MWLILSEIFLLRVCGLGSSIVQASIEPLISWVIPNYVFNFNSIFVPHSGILFNLFYYQYHRFIVVAEADG